MHQIWVSPRWLGETCWHVKREPTNIVCLSQLRRGVKTTKRDFTYPLKRHNETFATVTQSSTDLKTYISRRGRCKQAINIFLKPQPWHFEEKKKRHMEFKRKQKYFDLCKNGFNKVVNHFCKMYLKLLKSCSDCVAVWQDVAFTRYNTVTSFLPRACAHADTLIAKTYSHAETHPYSNMNPLIWLPVLQQLHDVR